MKLIKTYALTKRRQLGEQGEALAAGWLQQCGYTILHRNWRYVHKEIDLVACKDGVIHFVEVKTRRTLQFGLPEESVDDQKLAHIMTAAEAYLEQFPGFTRVQFDVIAVTMQENRNTTFFFVEDVC